MPTETEVVLSNADKRVQRGTSDIHEIRAYLRSKPIGYKFGSRELADALGIYIGSVAAAMSDLSVKGIVKSERTLRHNRHEYTLLEHPPEPGIARAAPGYFPRNRGEGRVEYRRIDIPQATPVKVEPIRRITTLEEASEAILQLGMFLESFKRDLTAISDDDLLAELTRRMKNGQHQK